MQICQAVSPCVDSSYWGNKRATHDIQRKSNMCMYSQRFFEKNFGRRCKVFWLPDSFGYSSQVRTTL